MKQIVLGVFLIMVFVFVVLFGYTRQQTLTSYVVQTGNLIKASCYVMPLNRRSAVRCHIDCLSLEKHLISEELCTSHPMKQIIVSPAVGERIEYALKIGSDVRIQLSADDIDQAKITQILIDGKSLLKPKGRKK